MANLHWQALTLLALVWHSCAGKNNSCLSMIYYWWAQTNWHTYSHRKEKILIGKVISFLILHAWPTSVSSMVTELDCRLKVNRVIICCLKIFAVEVILQLPRLLASICFLNMHICSMFEAVLQSYTALSKQMLSVIFTVKVDISLERVRERTPS